MAATFAGKNKSPLSQSAPDAARRHMAATFAGKNKSPLSQSAPDAARRGGPDSV